MSRWADGRETIFEFKSAWEMGIREKVSHSKKAPYDYSRVVSHVRGVVERKTTYSQAVDDVRGRHCTKRLPKP